VQWTSINQNNRRVNTCSSNQVVIYSVIKSGNLPFPIYCQAKHAPWLSQLYYRRAEQSQLTKEKEDSIRRYHQRSIFWRPKINTRHTFTSPNLGIPHTRHIVEERGLELVTHCIVVWSVTTCIQGVLGSNIGRHTGSPVWGLSLFSSVPRGKCLDRTSVSLRLFPFIWPTIWRCTSIF
jgi:hypothetical protein